MKKSELSAHQNTPRGNSELMLAAASGDLRTTQSLLARFLNLTSSRAYSGPAAP